AGLGVSNDTSAAPRRQSVDGRLGNQEGATQAHHDPFLKMAMSNPTGFVSLITAPPAKAIPLIDRMATTDVAHSNISGQRMEDGEEGPHHQAGSDRQQRGENPTELYSDETPLASQGDSSHGTGGIDQGAADGDEAGEDTMSPRGGSHAPEESEDEDFDFEQRRLTETDGDEGDYNGSHSAAE
ncbi:hypothetical protein FOZ62_017381, partial [Perkinsus olseni]